MKELFKAPVSKIVKQRRALLLSVFPAIQAVLLIGLFYRSEAWRDMRFLLYCGAVSGVFILVCILMIKLVRDTAGREKAQREAAFLQYEQQADQKYHELAQKHEKYLTDFESEIEDYLAAAYTLFEQQGAAAKESAMQLTAQLQQKSLYFTKLQYCENKIVNTILSLKTTQAAEAGIRTDITADIPEKLSVSQVDLCSLFSNLYDNAIQALQGFQTDIPIIIKAGCKEGYLLVKVHNVKQPKKAAAGGKSSPTDKKRKKAAAAQVWRRHGYGIEILKEIAEKYQGHLSVNDGESTFEVVVALRI